jgi:hypothetical protein
MISIDNCFVMTVLDGFVVIIFVIQNRAEMSASVVLNRRAAAHRNGNSKRVSIHAMKLYRENGSKAPHIPDIGTMLSSTCS